ncbi:MAG: rRNA maturation RNase YbeY [Bacilli bacterium]|nr:rRNA maturation RNase YbeY [Bacilli bacterium]
MNKVIFNNITNEKVEEENLVKEILEFAMEKENLENTSFSVIFVDNKYIHELNKTYRGIDRPTDVITFALEDEKDIINGSENRMLGDVYISLEKAHSQAEEYGHSFKRELSFLAVHGFYHLLGYDHMTPEEEKIMFGKQEEVLQEFDIKREV